MSSSRICTLAMATVMAAVLRKSKGCLPVCCVCSCVACEGCENMPGGGSKCRGSGSAAFDAVLSVNESCALRPSAANMCPAVLLCRGLLQLLLLCPCTGAKEGVLCADQRQYHLPTASTRVTQDQPKSVVGEMDLLMVGLPWCQADEVSR